MTSETFLSQQPLTKTKHLHFTHSKDTISHTQEGVVDLLG